MIFPQTSHSSGAHSDGEGETVARRADFRAMERHPARAASVPLPEPQAAVLSENLGRS
jgi:hypothetical protein